MYGYLLIRIINLNLSRCVKRLYFLSYVLIRHRIVMGIFTQAYMTVLHHGNDNLFFQLVADWIKFPQALPFYIFKLFTAAVITS